MATNEKHPINPVAAGIVGAVVGAAGTAAAMALSDKQTRDKVGNKIKELKDEGMRTYSEVKKRATKGLTDTKEKVKDVSEDIPQKK